MFECICEKRAHVERILHGIYTLTEDTRRSCWVVCDHTKINKIVQHYQLIVFILSKWGHIGDKIGHFESYNFDYRFDMNYMSFRTFQMSILISEIQRLCSKLTAWVKTCITAKKLNSLIQISSRISLVLQSPRHRALFEK